MHVTLRLVFAVFLLSASTAFPAEEPEETTPEDKRVFENEIEVTATRTEAKVQKVPVAVTVFSEAALEARSMCDLSDVADFTPNLDFSVSGGAGGAPSEATVYLRGVGQIETGIMADPGVGIYVDGVYIARSQGAVLDLLDLERVEVLRGPQGTLFGKNTTGGAIQLVTKKPDGVFGGYVRATLGSFDRREAALRVGGALSEKLHASLAAHARRRDGYATSLVTGRKLNDENRGSLRAALRWLASDNVLVDFTVEATRERQSALDQAMVAVFDSPLRDFVNRVRSDNGLALFDETFVTDDPRRSFSDGPSVSNGDIALASLRLAYTGPHFEALSITAYRDYEFEGASDFDGTPIRFFERSYVQTQDQFSQELQLSGHGAEGLRWLAGAIYFEEHPVDDSVAFSFDNTFELLEAAPGAIYPFPGGDPADCALDPLPPGLVCMGGAGNPANLFFFNGEGQVDLLDVATTSWAAFGELTWEVNERLSLSAGLRYTYEKKRTRFTSFVAPLADMKTELDEGQDWQAWSPRLALSYRMGDGVLWYISAAHGFKSGGFNAARSIGSPEVLVPFDQEDLLALEVGVKSDLGSHLRLNGALFNYDYDDVQFAAIVVDPEGNPAFTILNAADARVRGFEAELEALPAERSTIVATLGFVDSEYKELRNMVGAPTNGVFPKTPRWQASLSAQQTFEIGKSGALILRGDYSWRDDFFHDVTNSPFLHQDAYGIVNARASYLPPSGRWELVLFGTNLGDEAYFEHGFFSSGAGQATAIAGRPREWGFSAQWRF